MHIFNNQNSPLTSNDIFQMLKIYIFIITAFFWIGCTLFGKEDPSDNCNINESKAKELGENYADSLFDWGLSESVNFKESNMTYEISFPTESGEMALLGKRVIWVNCINEKVFSPLRD